ncbi:histidine kinase [Paenibacillus sp. JTLBN-2024]
MKLQAAGKASKWYVYQKIVIVFILFLLPLISMNIWLNYKGMSVTKNAILNSSQAGASFYSKQLDKEMYFIRNLQLQLINDKDLQKLSFRGSLLGDYEEVQLIEQVRDRLSTLMASSEYVVNSGVYVESIQKTISMNSGVTGTPNEEMKLMTSLSEVTPKPSFYRSGNRIFLIESANNGSIVTYIEISRPMLLQSLNEIAKLYPESEVLLGSQESGTMLTTAENADESEEILKLTADESVDQEPPQFKKMNGVNYFITRSAVGSLHLSMIMYVNQNELTRPLSQFITWFYTLFIIAIIVMILYSFSVNVMIHRPLSKLVKAFHMIETDNLNITIESKTKDEFHYVFNSFNNMARRLKNSIEENYEQKIALQHSQLKQLQSQINPHFLYNSFFNIYMMCVVGDSDSAAELSSGFGSYYYRYIGEKRVRRGSGFTRNTAMRWIIATFNASVSPTGVSFLNNEEETEIPPLITRVPRLIIQPIVENVFEHAFDRRHDGKEGVDRHGVPGRDAARHGRRQRKFDDPTG